MRSAASINDSSSPSFSASGVVCQTVIWKSGERQSVSADCVTEVMRNSP